ncbi:MAG: cellulase family glycosylhydrolase [Burkholderiaceae bacterium]|nr:cellulase family glycosylhydrolase [Microbacteriaceae bacterium]
MNHSLSAAPRFSRSKRMTGAAVTTALAATMLVAASAPASAVAAPQDWSTLNTEFVARDGSSLTLGGTDFRMSGANAYWLGLDENVGGVDYPTLFRIKDALDTASHLGVTVVRSHMMTSTGQDNENPLAIMPSLGEYNEEAFATIDFAIAYAGSVGIRLLLPLTDEWQYYHGGHRDFTTPLGLASADFYTDPTAIAAFDEYIEYVVGRTNAITGVRYVDDPTILAWELGNELEGMTLDWINARVALIGSLAPDQLVAAGGRFGVSQPALLAPGLDIVDAHYYPPTIDRVSADAALVVAARKVYLAGEYGSPAATTALLEPLAANTDVSGMFFWSLFPNNDRGGFVPHDDGFTVHYPGETTQSRAEVDAIVGYGDAIAGSNAVPSPALGAPLVTVVDRENGINRISWRGTAGADSYTVQSSGGAGWTDVAGPVSAGASPVTDFVSAPGTTYRVLAVGGATESVSDPVTATGRSSVLVDPLQSLLLTTGHSNVTLEADPSGALATGVAGQTSRLSWQRSGITRAEFLVADADGMSVASSADGLTWVESSTTTTTRDGRHVLLAEGLSGDHLRLEWATGTTVSRATISSGTAGGTVAVPGAFALALPADGTTGVRSTPVFSWTAADATAFYRFTLSLHPDLSEPLITRTGITATEFAPGLTLAPGTVHHWSVEALNGGGSMASTPQAAQFSTADLPTAPLVIDDFEGYSDDQGLTDAYVPNSGGGAVVSTLVESSGAADGTAARFDYDLGGEGYAGIVRTLAQSQDWWGYTGLTFWVDADAGHTLSVQFAASGAFWEANAVLPTSGWQQVELDFADFATPPWAGQAILNLSSVTEHAFYLGGAGSGTLVVDDLQTVLAAVPAPTDPAPTDPAPLEPAVPLAPSGSGADSLAATGTTGAGGALTASVLLMLLGLLAVCAGLRTRHPRPRRVTGTAS